MVSKLKSKGTCDKNILCAPLLEISGIDIYKYPICLYRFWIPSEPCLPLLVFPYYENR
jgi:hypothetical protein